MFFVHSKAIAFWYEVILKLTFVLVWGVLKGDSEKRHQSGSSTPGSIRSRQQSGDGSWDSTSDEELNLS